MCLMRQLLWLVMLAWSALAVQAAERYYRYQDANGTMVINSAITPQRAAEGGYDIIDENGRLIERIEPVLTGEALAERLREREQEAQRKAQEQAQKQYDLSLLQRYSFVSDIEAEEKRQVAQLQTRVAILRGNLIGFRADLEKAYESAAASERQNKPVAEKQQKQIASLEDRIRATELMLDQQQQEIDSTRQQYQRAIERFRELEKRRGRGSPANNP